MIGFVVMRDAATRTLQGVPSVTSVGHLALVEVVVGIIDLLKEVKVEVEEDEEVAPRPMRP